MQQLGRKYPDQSVRRLKQRGHRPHEPSADIWLCATMCCDARRCQSSRRLSPCASPSRRYLRGHGRYGQSDRHRPEAFDVINLPSARQYFKQLDYDRQATVRDRRIGRFASFSHIRTNQRGDSNRQSGAVRSSARGWSHAAHQPWRRWPDNGGPRSDEDVISRFPSRRRLRDGIFHQQAGSMERKTIQLSEVWLQVRT